MDSNAFLSNVRKMSWYRDQMVYTEKIPERAAQGVELDQLCHPKLKSALEKRGITSLYSHQYRSLLSLRSGSNVIVATKAASGKSLCYNLPVLEALLEDRTSRALYLFPTKALTQDQLRGFGSLVPHMVRVRAGVFDGDTPSDERSHIRRNAHVVMSNPDMLHLGILPNHGSWRRFLRGLKFVVLDEAHVYRGVFGSHVANILRRLRRLCARYGSSPRFVLSSATIENPLEHARSLTGLPFEVIDEDGSPYGGKDFVLWNPPIVDEATGKRHSTNSEVTLLLLELLSNETRNLTFVRSRRLAELIYVYVRDQLKERNPGLMDQIAPYRATYLREDRRRLERDLFEGRILSLVSTNAMELGVDVGDLDATILTGFPGSLASTWQQAGRSGRRGERSLSILVAQNNPLDQYIMRHPEALFGKPHESARISTTNPYILRPHLLCAAYEMPLGPHDDIFGPAFAKVVQELADEGYLRSQGESWHLDPRVAYPAQEVNIRSSSSRTYSLVERDSGVVLETMDEPSVFFQLHPGAVYLHQGTSYLVAELDMESLTAYAVESEVPYYTETRDFTDTRILRALKQKKAGRTGIYWGEVEVSTTVVGFKRKAHFTEEVLGEEYIKLPSHVFNTVALWFDIPEEILRSIISGRLDLAGGLHACEHAAIGVLPLFAMCDRNDIGGLSTPLHPDTGRPQIFIHDGHPGGVGISEHGYERIEELWSATLEAISTCPCDSGCPSCVQSPKCGNNNQPLDKRVAEIILKGVLG